LKKGSDASLSNLIETGLILKRIDEQATGYRLRVQKTLGRNNDFGNFLAGAAKHCVRLKKKQIKGIVAH
jgi:hypothetical protein